MVGGRIWLGGVAGFGAGAGAGAAGVVGFAGAAGTVRGILVPWGCWPAFNLDKSSVIVRIDD